MNTYCYSSVAERPAGFEKKMQTLLESGEMPTLDQFVISFSGEYLPRYHGSIDAPKGHPDLPGFLLAYESMSPAQRYVSMEKARDVIPDWKTMSILKKHYYPGPIKISHRGVRFHNVFYKHNKLTEIGTGESVSVLCHSFTPPFAPESITVLYQGDAACEAFPANKNDYTDASPEEISDTLELQRRPAAKMKKAVSRLSKRAHEILPEGMTQPKPSKKEQLREFVYGQTPEEEECSQADNETIAEAIKSSNAATQEEYDKAYDLLFGTM